MKTTGAVLAAVGAPFIMAGVPMIVVGAKQRHRTSDPRPDVALLVVPTSATLSVRF